MIIFHFIIFELELIITLFLIFGLISFNSNNLIVILLSYLFIDLLLSYFGILY